MLKRLILIVSFLLVSSYGIAQKTINNYKYIIVPEKFDFSESGDQYQLNSLTKFLFNKYGYKAYFVNDDMPQDLVDDRCLALTSVVTKAKGGLFKTKLEISLKDCFGVVIMTSQVGESRLKKFDKAYNEALRNAFKTYQTYDYQYMPNEAQNDASTKAVSTGLIMVNPNQENSTEILEKKNEIGQTTTTEGQNKNNLYYAQAIENGFQLVNAEPRIVMVLLNTGAQNVYLVQGKSAIVFKEDGFWYYSENNGKLEGKKVLNI